MKKDIPEKEEILQVLQAHSPRAMHVGALCDRLDVSRGAKDEIVRRLLLLADEVLVSRSAAENRSKPVEVAEGKRKKPSVRTSRHPTARRSKAA